MPAWVKDDDIWEKAKKQASEEGHSDDYGYVTEIYKEMHGRIGKALDPILKSRSKEQWEKVNEHKEKEYGDIHKFADPDHHSYPIDTPEHIRAAWSYINHPNNANKYSSDKLKEVKSRIRSAAKKHGITISSGDDDAKKSFVGSDGLSYEIKNGSVVCKSTTIIPGHYRHTKGGKQVYVQQHERHDTGIPTRGSSEGSDIIEDIKEQQEEADTPSMKTEGAEKQVGQGQVKKSLLIKDVLTGNSTLEKAVRSDAGDQTVEGYIATQQDKIAGLIDSKHPQAHRDLHDIEQRISLVKHKMHDKAESLKRQTGKEAMPVAGSGASSITVI